MGKVEDDEVVGLVKGHVLLEPGHRGVIKRDCIKGVKWSATSDEAHGHERIGKCKMITDFDEGKSEIQARLGDEKHRRKTCGRGGVHFVPSMSKRMDAPLALTYRRFSFASGYLLLTVFKSAAHSERVCTRHDRLKGHAHTTHSGSRDGARRIPSKAVAVMFDPLPPRTSMSDFANEKLPSPIRRVLSPGFVMNRCAVCEGPEWLLFCFIFCARGIPSWRHTLCGEAERSHRACAS